MNIEKNPLTNQKYDNKYSCFVCVSALPNYTFGGGDYECRNRDKTRIFTQHASNPWLPTF